LRIERTGDTLTLHHEEVNDLGFAVKRDRTTRKASVPEMPKQDA